MMTNELRTKSIKIRVTPSEHEQLTEIRKRDNANELARWMRETCLNVKVTKQRDFPTVDPDLLRQLAGMGNNLNQIARQVNTNQSVLNSDAMRIISHLALIERELLNLRNDWSIKNDR